MNSIAKIADGLFEIDTDGARLIGSRCTSCDTLYFPQALSCRNPICREKAVIRAALPTHGTLHSYTIQHYRPPPLFRMDDWAPYAIGLVDLSGGLRVMGMLTDIALDRISIGMAMTLVAESLFDDAERGPVLTYKFAPSVAASAA